VQGVEGDPRVSGKVEVKGIFVYRYKGITGTGQTALLSGTAVLYGRVKGGITPAVV
jgi:hypothetical protein